MLSLSCSWMGVPCVPCLVAILVFRGKRLSPVGGLTVLNFMGCLYGGVLASLGIERDPYFQVGFVLFLRFFSDCPLLGGGLLTIGNIVASFSNAVLIEGDGDGGGVFGDGAWGTCARFRERLGSNYEGFGDGGRFLASLTMVTRFYVAACLFVVPSCAHLVFY